MTILISLLIVGWLAASVIVTQAYFQGEQSKPIHERNWRSNVFEILSKSITGSEIEYTKRVPVYVIDSYSNRFLPKK